MVPCLSEPAVHLVVVLHEPNHLHGVILVPVLHVRTVHLGAVLQLGQRRPQDLDLPRHGEHIVRLVVVLQDFPHLHGVVLGLGLLLGVGLLVLNCRTRAGVVVPRLGVPDGHLGELLNPLHSDGVGLLVLVCRTRADIMVPRLGELTWSTPG